MKQHQMSDLSAGHGFLEAPRWHDGRLWLSDFFRKHVITISDDGHVEKVLDVEQSPSGLGFLSDGSMLIVSQHDKKLLRRTADGSVTDYAKLADVNVGLTNDMLVTSSGHAYVGNFGFDLGTEDPRVTNLVHVRPDRSISVVPGDVLFPNGMGVLPGGTTLVVCETFGHRISAFDIQTDGSLTNQRVWAQLAEVFSPDGMAVDSDGGVWFANALTEGPESGFYRVEEGGEITDAIYSSDSWGVACTFGGPANDVLYLVCNDTSLDRFGNGDSNGMVRTASVGRTGA